jgi:hypothetical protein
MFIDMGRLAIPSTPKLITIQDLLEVGLIGRVAKHGVKLLADKHNYPLRTPIHIEVNKASSSAIEKVEAAGGTVTSIYLNRLARRAMVRPYSFKKTLLPRRARPTPKDMAYYLDDSKRGYLSPYVQIRNRRLFGGQVTSEQRLREEHARTTLDMDKEQYQQVVQLSEEVCMDPEHYFKQT